MVQDMEENFPRGGKNVTKAVKRKPKNDTLFGNPTKKQKKEKVEKKAIVDVDQIITNVGMLTRQTISEGMKVLACIKKITENALEVELPGLIIGKVMIDSISETLVKTLRKALSDSSKITSVSEILKSFFHCGQYVPLYIKTIQVTDDKSVIFGSISPKDVNSDRRHNSFKKGELIWASISSELDHGYQLECGVANCRIFLPNQYIEERTKLDVGQPIWCKVHRVDSDNAASTLRVGIKRQHIDSVLTDDTIPLNSILPGTKVEVYVEKVIKNGIRCKFLENYTGFIHESQLYPAMKSLKTIKEASIMCAYVLYVENITKIAQLSMRGLDSTYEIIFERGTKVSGEVIGKNEIGVYFKLNKQEKGWISNKRLLNNSAGNTKSDNYLNEKFSKGSKHRCVVLSYSHMDRVYICSIEKELLKEKYFSYLDLKVGELVEGTIQEIKKNGIVLTVGKVKGFVPNIHLTDVLYSEFLKRKFAVGSKVKARVFSSNEKSVIFTLKQSFLKDDKYFTDVESVIKNEVYPALVLKAKNHGVALSFYNNIEGYVPFKEYNFPITQEYRDNPSSFFYSGQVIKVRVIKVQTDKVVASLKLDASINVSIELGKNVKGIVKEKEENGLRVFISKLNIEGFVPVEHLSIDSSLCRPMLETYSEDDEISNLMILKTDETGTILSRREAIAYERCDLKVPKFQNIKKNTILRCSIESIEDNGVFVYSPIKNFNKKLFVKKKYVTKEKTMPKFEVNQGVLAKVIEIDRVNETIELSLKSENVFDKNYQNSISLFIEYLADEEYLRKYGSENNWPINDYNLCEKVQCTVKQSTNKGCLVELPNGVRGLVVPTLSTSIKKGDEVEGMVLGYNYQLNYVELCLNPTVMKTINSNQDGMIPENEPQFTLNKLLTRDQYVLAVTRKSANRQLVYLPLRLCENDSNDYLKKYYETDTFKVDICGKYEDKLIGFHKKLKHSLDYTYILKNTNWSELDASLYSEEVDSLNTSQESFDGEPSQQESVESDNEDIDSEEEECDISPEDEDVEMEELSDTNKDSGVYSNSLNGTTNGSEKGVVAESEINEDSEKRKTKIRFSGEERRQFEDRDQINCPLAVLPSISNFFTAELTKEKDDSSSDDEDEEDNDMTKKKKLSAAEKRKKNDKNEDSKNVQQVAVPTQEDESVEHYEQLLMNNPNSSTLWLKYIAFCIATFEHEKARIIAKRALASISTTCEDDKFNIWMTLLNIENSYGSKESFDNVFDEAIKYNDAFKIYMRVTELLFKSGKHVEMEDKIRKMRAKFKNEPEMWVHIAKLYYLIGNFQEARNVKNLCLKSVSIKKEQYNLILKFAILEFAHGEIDTGIMIFESVLVSYPNKVGAWLVYIDQLISKNQIKEARDVLNRAITLTLPLKSIKVIYQKYRTFEEKYGTPATLAAFKEKAKSILQEKIQAVS